MAAAAAAAAGTEEEDPAVAAGKLLPASMSSSHVDPVSAISVAPSSSSSAEETVPFLQPFPTIIRPIDRDRIDLEAGPGEQPQCRICLESDG